MFYCVEVDSAGHMVRRRPMLCPAQRRMPPRSGYQASAGLHQTLDGGCQRNLERPDTFRSVSALIVVDMAPFLYLGHIH